MAAEKSEAASTTTITLKSSSYIPNEINQYLFVGLIFALSIIIQLPQNILAASIVTTVPTTTKTATVTIATIPSTIILSKRSSSSAPSSLSKSSASATATATLSSVLNFNQQQQHQQLVHQSHIITECNELWSLRLRKRQTANWHGFNRNNDERISSSSSHQSPDWINPCGGQYVDRKIRGKFNNIRNNKRRRKLKEQRLLRKIWRKLLNITKNEYKTLKLTTSIIAIDDIQIWRVYQEYYDVLPKLPLNATISLRRWHRHLQIYVASFAYLRRAQLHWIYNNSVIESSIAEELKTLKLSARNILCNIEAALNSTLAASDKGNKRKQMKLFVFKPQTMAKKLKFQMHMGKSMGNWPTAYSSNYEIDLKFVKYYYFHYLRRMIKNLKYNIKNLQKRNI